MYWSKGVSSNFLNTILLAFVPVLCLAGANENSRNEERSALLEGRLKLKQYNDKRKCEAIENYLENNLFSDNGAVESLVDWKKAYYKRKGDEGTNRNTRKIVYTYKTSEKIHGNKKILAREKDFLGGFEFHRVYILKENAFEGDSAIFSSDDVYSGFDKLDALRGQYRLWPGMRRVKTTWIDYFEFGGSGYFLFYPTELNSIYKSVYLVAKIGGENVGKRGYRLNSIKHECLYHGDDFWESKY